MTEPTPDTTSNKTIDELISWLKNYAQTQDDTERVNISGYGHLYVIVINGAHDCSESEKVLARIEQDDVGPFLSSLKKGSPSDTMDTLIENYHDACTNLAFRPTRYKQERLRETGKTLRKAIASLTAASLET